MAGGWGLGLRVEGLGFWPEERGGVGGVRVSGFSLGFRG